MGSGVRRVAIGAVLTAVMTFGAALPASAGYASWGYKSCTEGRLATSADGNYTITHRVGNKQLIDASTSSALRASTFYSLLASATSAAISNPGTLQNARYLCDL